MLVCCFPEMVFSANYYKSAIPTLSLPGDVSLNFFPYVYQSAEKASHARSRAIISLVPCKSSVWEHTPQIIHLWNKLGSEEWDFYKFHVYTFNPAPCTELNHIIPKKSSKEQIWKEFWKHLLILDSKKVIFFWFFQMRNASCSRIWLSRTKNILGIYPSENNICIWERLLMPS